MCTKVNVLSFQLWGYVSRFIPIQSTYPLVKWYYREVILEEIDKLTLYVTIFESMVSLNAGMWNI